MFRNILLFILIGIFSFRVAVNSLILLDWKLNQKEITATFCINKNKPKLHCNGKCYLAKKINQQEEIQKNNESKKTKKLVSLKATDVYAKNTISYLIPNWREEKINHRNREVNYSFQFNRDIFRPPSI